MVSYKPLWTATLSGGNANEFPYFSGGVIAADLTSSYPGGVPPGVLSSDMQAVLARSQRTHIHLYPQTNAGGDMILPFIYPKDCLNLSQFWSAGSVTNAAMNDLGTLFFDTIVKLTSTAGPNTKPVNVSVYAWCEDIMLWGPTSTTLNGGEFDQPIDKPSAVASSVAKTAAKLQSVPYIGPYATATSLIASAAASTLRLMGFSNPPVVTAVTGQVPRNTFANPSPVISQQYDVLALDPKNETTIDPSIVGCSGGKDELNIANICARPAIIDTFVWQAADVEGTVLANLPVVPCYARTSWIVNTADPSTNCARITMTPATYVAQLFKYWRGTFRLHIKAVCSQFHRGRLCISYDPVPGTNAEVTGARICKILDLASADEMTFDIPMMSHFAYLQVPDVLQKVNTAALAGKTYWINRSTGGDGILPNSDIWHWSNGAVLITVLNDLQVAEASSDVTLVASVSFQDMEFFCPRVDSVQTAGGAAFGAQNYAMRNLTLNGGEAPVGDEVKEEISATVAVDHLPLVYAGERVPSLRSLLHRSMFYRAVVYTTTTARALVRICLPRFPTPKHCRLPLVFDSATGTTGAPFGTNLVATLPITYITGCFVGYRGSLVWSAVNTEGYTRNITTFSSIPLSIHRTPHE
uniref:Capsid protein VP4 dicistrovirus domain-containing protein n=1 Tax=Lactuca sativa picorna-like virus TaxID=2739853 RepID=A0A6M9BSD4_9VIRU|nr:hypothetical protein 2 [Lactuca sativa picorna-like virus]